MSWQYILYPKSEKLGGATGQEMYLVIDAVVNEVWNTNRDTVGEKRDRKIDFNKPEKFMMTETANLRKARQFPFSMFGKFIFI